MVLGNINGVPVESILQAIPNPQLRQAYHHALESLVATQGAQVLQSTDRLLESLHTLSGAPGPHNYVIDQSSFYNQIASGHIHGDQYVAAAYVLAAVIGSRSDIRVDSGLFRINPLWQEHLTYLNLFEDVREAHAHLRETPIADLTMTIGSTPPIVRSAQAYIRYMNEMNNADSQAWSALEVHSDSGLARSFIDLEYRFRQNREVSEEFRQIRRMTSEQFHEFMESFEAGIPKSEPSGNSVSASQTVVPPPEGNLSIEPPCAPNDPSCEN